MIRWKKAVCIAAVSLFGAAGIGVVAPASAGTGPSQGSAVQVRAIPGAAEVRAQGWWEAAVFGYGPSAFSKVAAWARCVDEGQFNLRRGNIRDYDCEDYPYGLDGSGMWILWALA